MRDAEDAGARGAATVWLLMDGLLGVLTCLGLVLATNAIFTRSWGTVLLAGMIAVGCVAWLSARIPGTRLVVVEKTAGGT